MGDTEMPAAVPPSAAAPQPARKSSKPAPGKVRGFADLGGDSDSDDSDGPREYYTGGEKRCVPSARILSCTQGGPDPARRGHAGPRPHTLTL
jgi:hypothetical protein